MTDFIDILAVAALVGGIVAAIAGYAKALSEVKMGRLIVYRDWGDFILSSLWLVLVPYGACSLFDGGAEWPARTFGALVLFGGVASFWRACAGAFRYNVGSSRWLALYARFAVTLLFVLALGKLQEKFDQYKRGELGIIRGVLIPVLIFAWVFREFIQPMIGLQYYHAWRLARE